MTFRVARPSPQYRRFYFSASPTPLAAQHAFLATGTASLSSPSSLFSRCGHIPPVQSRSIKMESTDITESEEFKTLERVAEEYKRQEAESSARAIADGEAQEIAQAEASTAPPPMVPMESDRRINPVF